MAVVPPQDVLYHLIDVVNGDTALPPSVRRQARDLVSVAQDAPGVAWDRLVTLSREVAERLPREQPTEDLLRLVGVGAFHLHHLRDDVRAFYADPAAYAADVASEPDPARRLLADLDREDPLFPAEHSWLVPASQMTGVRSGAEARAALETSTDPPFVVFRLTRERLVASGVTVRAPRAVDAVPGCYVKWRSAGVAGGQTELIDRDIPVSCLEEVLWLP